MRNTLRCEIHNLGFTPLESESESEDEDNDDEKEGSDDEVQLKPIEPVSCIKSFYFTSNSIL